MKRETTSKRLKSYMDNHNLRQVDILAKAKPYTEKYGIRLNKNDLSQYVSGKVEPGQDKIFILSKALKVDPTWIMGFDITDEYTNLSKSFKYHVERLEMPYLTFHGLRHTHASILFELGASSQEISKRLRHSRVSTTDDIYIHIKEDTKKSTADLFNQAVENK